MPAINREKWITNTKKFAKLSTLCVCVCVMLDPPFMQNSTRASTALWTSMQSWDFIVKSCCLPLTVYGHRRIRNGRHVTLRLVSVLCSDVRAAEQTGKSVDACLHTSQNCRSSATSHS